jgi:hypothetical protein
MKQAMLDSAQRPKFDHFNTPDYAAEPLARYILRSEVIWEPTDTEGKSGITRLFRKCGNKVISTGKNKLDFLKDAPDFHFDCVITNPPYSLKDEFIRRCIELKTRWALLLPITALEGVGRRKLFDSMASDFGLLVLDRRVEFTGGGSVWYNTSWFCYGILPRQLAFAELSKEQKVRSGARERRVLGDT